MTLLSTAACAPLPEAPEEVTELSPFLFIHHENDPRVLEDAVANLREGLAQIDLDASRAERGWIPLPLALDDVAALGPEGTDPEDCVAAGLVARTAHPPELHAELATRIDQVPAEPTATDYERRFLDPVDPACFPGQDCGALVTVNDVRRENILYAARFDLHKGFRWAGDDAIVARSWLDRSWTGEAGNTELIQSYGIDVVTRLDSGETVRLQVAWGEVDLGVGVSEDFSRATIRAAIDQVIEQTDEAIDELID